MREIAEEFNPRRMGAQPRMRAFVDRVVASAHDNSVVRDDSTAKSGRIPSPI
jgi:hypothetical protein